MNKLAIIAVAAVLGLAVAAIVFFNRAEQPVLIDESEYEGRREIASVQSRVPSSHRSNLKQLSKRKNRAQSYGADSKRGVQKGAGKETASEVLASPETELTEQERKVFDDIQAAMDSDDSAQVRKLCATITAASKRELREQAVVALGWFDGETMAELTPFLVDPDESIASDALFQWQESLNQISSDAQKASLIASAMNILTDDSALDQLSLLYAGLDERIAVQSLVGVISGSNAPGVEKGKEMYEHITGENYTTPEAAEKWLKDNVCD